jgi:hypothetical protein
MVAALCPVDAAAAVVPLGAARLREVDAEPLEESFTGRSDLAAAVDEHYVATAQEHVAHGDPQAPRHVVVTHPRFPKRGLDAMVRPAVGWRGRHGHQSLDGPRDLRGAQTIVTTAPLFLHGQQVAGEQAREMAARRRRGHPREVGQFFRGQRAARE